MRAWLTLCLVCGYALAQRAGHGSISGTVVDASNNEAVRKAVVTLTWQGTPRAWATTRTDGSGRFIFDGLPAGKYDLNATKAWLGTAKYGSESTRELGDFISLGDGETIRDVKLRFLRSATISGRVLDAPGDPISGVSVNLLRAGQNPGERGMARYQGATSDDRGEYKMTVPGPGEYYLHCAPATFSMGPVMPGPHLRDDEMLVPQYYGGAMESKDAAPLKFRGGEVLTGMDFHLIPQHAAAISGRVTGVPPADPSAQPVQGSDIIVRRGFRPGGQSVSVEITPSGEDDRLWNEGTGANGPDYHFEFPGLPPGHYRVQATVRTKDKTYYAEQTVDAHEGSTEVPLVLSPPVEVKGHLRIEGPIARAENATVELRPSGGGHSGQAYTAKVGKDGSFVIQNVAPAEFFLQINPSPEGAFEKSVLLGDKSFLYKSIEIPPGLDAPLNIVVSTNTATVEGEVDAGKRAGILMAPVGERRKLMRFYSSAIADDTGKFKLTGVAPGKYKIFALEKIAPRSFENPESVDLLDNLGEELTVPEGAIVQSHPKLIPLETVRDLLKP